MLSISVCRKTVIALKECVMDTNLDTLSSRLALCYLTSVGTCHRNSKLNVAQAELQTFPLTLRSLGPFSPCSAPTPQGCHCCLRLCRGSDTSLVPNCYHPGPVLRHPVPLQALHSELENRANQVRCAEKKLQHKELEAQEQITYIRQEYETKFKGLMPVSLRQELEDTISSLKSQVNFLQKRASILQEELATYQGRR
uniref:Centrosomal protein 112 n=1 Tax=Molossus molossus TaxID=27622 RepID=A0A7J8CWT2_MOLMO|nr:centrosomal protein 112 [Molossus molossus]